MTTSIHFYHEHDTEIAYIYTDVIPRVGDEIHYYVESPPSYETVDGGTVARVKIEYRHMLGWGTTDKLYPMVLVYLDDLEEVFDVS